MPAIKNEKQALVRKDSFEKYDLVFAGVLEHPPWPALVHSVNPTDADESVEKDSGDDGDKSFNIPREMAERTQISGTKLNQKARSGSSCSSEQSTVSSRLSSASKSHEPELSVINPNLSSSNNNEQPPKTTKSTKKMKAAVEIVRKESFVKENLVFARIIGHPPWPTLVESVNEQ